jgi:hypothetical protein
MLASRGGGPSKHQPGTMNLRQILRTGLPASAIVHASVLTLVLWLAEAHPFGSVPAETIAVDVVTPDEVAQKTPEPDPTPTPVIPSPSIFDAAKTAASSPATPAAAASAPQKQAALPPSRPERPQAKAQPQPPAAQAQPASAQPQPPPASPAPPSTTTSYKPPEPDLSIKYHVMLGLPQGNIGPLPPAASGDKSGDGGDAATAAADVSSSLVAEFRRHLRTCSKLPASVAASDNVMIKLRVFMTPDGKLEGAPALIEASASMKGPLLMQSAIAALEACQPYAMMPADRYGEWKVLDLNFTPRDFAG